MAEVTVLEDLAEDLYHADPCPAPSLSSSIAHVLVEQSPLHAWLQHPKLGGEARRPTKALDRGSLIHQLVLGAGPDVCVIDAPDFRTKAAREERDQAREAGEIPVLAKEYDDALEAVARIRANLLEQGIELTGRSEVSIIWQEAVDDCLIWCRSRLDHVIAERATIYDLKTARSARPVDCAKAVANYGYDIQRAAYVRAMEAAVPGLEGRLDYVILFVEPEPPYAVLPARLDGAFRERGERRWRQACATWARCLRDDQWPGYGPGPVYLEAPRWAVMEG